MVSDSAAAELLHRPKFDDGEWHTLDELQTFEALLLAMRERNKAYSDAVRIDTSPAEKLRRDELIPLLNFAKHEGLPGNTPFRKPKQDDGIDIEYVSAGSIVRLQITTAYPVWVDSAGKHLNGGYQYRFHMEKLTANGHLLGTGPFERRGAEIINHEGYNSWEEIEESHRLGLIEAFRLKRSRVCKDVSLLVRAVGYYEAIHDVERFHAMVDAAAQVVFPRGFARVIVVDYGDGFTFSRES